MVANADPKEVESTVEKIQEVEKELVKVEQNLEESEQIQGKVVVNHQIVQIFGPIFVSQ